MAAPPALGSTNWGTPLDTYMASILTEATTALNNISTHAVAVDPHGDRAYSLGLVNPILTGTNTANGYVKLNSSGLVPNSLLPSAGGLASTFDVSSATFGGVGNGINDDTSALQGALTAAATAGGGEVWVPNGTWTVSSTLVIGNNTWLHLSPGAVMVRKINSGTGLLPGIMLANFSASTSRAQITGNILISGGVWDATAANTQSVACTVLQLANAAFCGVEQTVFVAPKNNSAVQLFGCNLGVIRDVLFETYTPTGLPSAVTAPAIQIAQASSVEMPAGLNSSMYSNAICQQVLIQSVIVTVPIGGYLTAGGQSFGGFGYAVGTMSTPIAATHTLITVSDCVANGVTQNFWKANLWFNVLLSDVQVNSGYNTSSAASISTSGVVLDSAGVPTIRATNVMLNLDVEQWTKMTPLVNFFTNGIVGSQGPQASYRINMNKRTLDVAGAITLPGGSNSYNNTLFFSLPYLPLTTRRWPAFPYNATGFNTAAFPGPPRVELASNGSLTLEGVQGAINGTNIDISGFGIPLDY